MSFNLSVEPDGTDKAEFSTKGISLDPKAIDSVFTNDGTSIVIHANSRRHDDRPVWKLGREDRLRRHHDSNLDVAQLR